MEHDCAAHLKDDPRKNAPNEMNIAGNYARLLEILVLANNKS
jgi:hypothetical protein